MHNKASCHNEYLRSCRISFFYGHTDFLRRSLRVMTQWRIIFFYIQKLDKLIFCLPSVLSLYMKNLIKYIPNISKTKHDNLHLIFVGVYELYNKGKFQNNRYIITSLALATKFYRTNPLNSTNHLENN